jgi:hypothetical protein
MFVFNSNHIPEDFTGEVTIAESDSSKRIIRLVNGLRHCETGWAMYWLDDAPDPDWYYLDGARFTKKAYWQILYKKYRHDPEKAPFYMSKILGSDM